MFDLNIKPLSVNEAWQGRRFKTGKYLKYSILLDGILPQISLPCPPYELIINFRFSASSSDIDNPLKPFIDVMQKKYKFNDRDIYKLVVTKEVVKKGEEGISFEINHVIPNGFFLIGAK